MSEREALAAWMIANSYATGHGDTIESLIAELDWQHKERLNALRASLNDELIACLTDLVCGLNETPWSSWQTTYRFTPQLDAANKLLARIAEGRP